MARTTIELEGRYWSEAELADRLRLSPTTLRTWRCRGQGPCFVKAGRRVLYPESCVERWEHNLARHG
jgi:hypothetical protein